MNKKDHLSRTILDAIPSPIFVVEEDVKIVDFNAAAAKILGQDRSLVLRNRAGDVFHCLNAMQNPQGCGRSAACKDCVIRNSVNESLQGKGVLRKRTKMTVESGGTNADAHYLITTAPFSFDNKPLALLILEDISEIVTLQGILPICAHCKKVRSDKDYWENVENYFRSHLDVEFSHGICPECLKKYYSKFT
ncbi:MAG TPA: PAS domain-containing protein [Chitinivibrionales bacterium]|jgi:PAS domain-containing protein|nr:PAS domain-containing protein [Chitinivibrionales bacterium]